MLDVSTLLNFIFLPDPSRYDGTTVDTITPPQYCHTKGGMASSLGRPVVVEGGHHSLEIMDLTTFEWSLGTRQQFYGRLFYFMKSIEWET